MKWELEKDVEEPVDSTTTPHRIWLTHRSALLVSKVLSIVAKLASTPAGIDHPSTTENWFFPEFDDVVLLAS